MILRLKKQNWFYLTEGKKELDGEIFKKNLCLQQESNHHDAVNLDGIFHSPLCSAMLIL